MNAHISQCHIYIWLAIAISRMIFSQAVSYKLVLNLFLLASFQQAKNKILELSKSRAFADKRIEYNSGA